MGSHIGFAAAAAAAVAVALVVHCFDIRRPCFRSARTQYPRSSHSGHSRSHRNSNRITENYMRMVGEYNLEASMRLPRTMHLLIVGSLIAADAVNFGSGRPDSHSLGVR